jgi:hypothetical protein
MLRKTLDYRIADAERGVLWSGELEVDALRARQPWEAPKSAQA